MPLTPSSKLRSTVTSILALSVASTAAPGTTGDGTPEAAAKVDALPSSSPATPRCEKGTGSMKQYLVEVSKMTTEVLRVTAPSIEKAKEYAIDGVKVRVGYRDSKSMSSLMSTKPLSPDWIPVTDFSIKLTDELVVYLDEEEIEKEVSDVHEWDDVIEGIYGDLLDDEPTIEEITDAMVAESLAT
jgi:hypothetical protein